MTKEVFEKPFYLITKYDLSGLQGFVKIGDDREEITKLFEDRYMWKPNTMGVTEESYQLLECNAKEIMNDRTNLDSLREKEVKKFIKRRDDLLINFESMNDKELLTELLELNNTNVPSSPEIARIGLHKARLYSKDVSNELKEKSKNWLVENGYSTDIFDKEVE